MPYRKEKFINGDIYHIIIRGIDGNIIFKDTDDHFRGIFSIYEFNNAAQVEIRDRRRSRVKTKAEEAFQELKKSKTCGGPTSADVRDKLVEVLAFCFMRNHLHLLLRQVKSEGINRFMTKVGTGYAGYFNRKYSRQGYVFQKRFTAVHIKTDEQLKVIFAYIHTNPASFIEPKWKDVGIKDPRKIIKFLKSYKWSSYFDYIGKNNFPSVTDREFILETMGGPQSCERFIKNWVEYKQRGLENLQS